MHTGFHSSIAVVSRRLPVYQHQGWPALGMDCRTEGVHQHCEQDGRCEWCNAVPRCIMQDQDMFQERWMQGIGSSPNFLVEWQLPLSVDAADKHFLVYSQWTLCQLS